MTRDRFRFRYALSPAVSWLPAAVLAVTSACSSEVASEPICDAPYSNCGGVCVALRSDRDHCGACGNECSSGELCVAGACEARPPQGAGVGGSDGVPGGDGGGPEDDGGAGGDPAACDETRYVKRCDGACVDTRTDPDHCGRCGQACDPGRACAGGRCQPICREGFTECAGACVDLDADAQHCGRCGHACDPGQPCEAGSCGCSTEPSEDIGSTVPQRVSGTTRGADDSRLPSCGAPDTADHTFLFTAPTTGTYFFDTLEAPFDTTLAALAASTCAELACNDDGEGIQSQIAVDLLEGESILVVVSGASGAEGDFTLRVTQPGPVMCTPTALEPVVPQTLTGTTVGLEDSVYYNCGVTSLPDATYTFAAPEAGTYVFSARVPEETIIDILDGGACDGDSLGCQYGYGQTNKIVELDAGQTVLVAVSGPSGPLTRFALDIFEAPPCPGQDLGSTVPQTVTGSNEGLSNVLSACYAFSTGGEATYGFTAPRDGVYLFDTEGSTFPVLMEVRRGSCAGEIVTCSDSELSPARITTPLTAGETAVIVLDTYSRTGDYRLEISEIACPVIDLGSTAPQTVTGTTAGFTDVLAPSCGYSGGPEVTYRFTAPADGLYTFNTEGSAFDTTVDVRDGSCAGRSLRCNDNVDPTGELTHSQVSLLLSADQTVIVSVDSNFTSGEYTLNVTQQEAPPCPLIDLGSTVPQTVTGSNEGYPDLLTPECGGGAGGEATYRFTAPAEGYYVFDTAGSTIETVLSVREDGCGGPELACASDGARSRTIVWLEAEQTVVLSVDSNGDEGEYMLNAGQFDGSGTCEAPIELASVVPQTATGTTRGSLEERGASCGGSSAPEVLYSFTAPEAGTYTIDTHDSEYDTVLAVFHDDCSGDELACSDDAPPEGDWFPVTSELTVSLDAGQTILIQVDGYDRSSGSYALNIRR
ncbi:MXAN_6577-like cysteine-rich protein [Sorangium sp. So ce406]|uniref:MXAN_6577-like cysteine-rich protein n=1 Tax=Sorangium sp. So ce406 TaxID=3133311 RepID=UPI003F5C7B9A